MKNRITVRHGMLEDLAAYLAQSGWKLEDTKGSMKSCGQGSLGGPSRYSYMTVPAEGADTASTRGT